MHTLTHTTNELAAIARRWIAFWRGDDPSAFNEIHHPDFIDHSPSGRSQDREGFRQGIEDLYRSFPDFNAQIDDLVVDPEIGKVAIRWTAVGTHHDTFLGVSPIGKQIRFTGIEIIEIRNGLVVARWGEWNGLDILEQLSSDS